MAPFGKKRRKTGSKSFGKFIRSLKTAVWYSNFDLHLPLLSSQRVDDFVRHHAFLKAYPLAEESVVRNVSNWFKNNPGAILGQETAFIEHTEVLVCIIPKIKTPLRRALERLNRIHAEPTVSSKATAWFAI